MVCSPVHGDNPRVLASRLSPVNVDNHGFTYISVDLAHYEIVCAKVSKSGINLFV